MDFRIKTWLLDILQCIDEIYIFLGEQNDFLAYRADLKTKKAIERQNFTAKKKVIF
jgi:hypothetical protein